MSFPRYPEYKDSGVEWLGEVPAHWAVSRLKFFGDLITGITPPSDDLSNYSESGWPWIRPDDLDDSGSAVEASKTLTDKGWSYCRAVKPNSTLVCCIGSIGKLGYAESRVCTNQQITAVEPDRHSRYVFYLLYAMKPALDLFATGNVLRILNAERLGNVPVVMPPGSEADPISDFLDHETGKIDALIEEQRRLVELLKEKRQAVISHAVTKGLDPSVPMKDSGVEWLGEVPAHWDVVKLKYLITSFEQGWSPQCENIPRTSSDEWAVLKVGCVNHSRFSPDENKLLPGHLDPAPELSVRAGDVLISRANTRELIGSAAMASTHYPRLMISDKLFRVRTDSSVCPEWLAFYLGSDQLRPEIEVEATGASSSMLNIGQGVLKELAVPLPSREEQAQIVGWLDESLSGLEALRAEVEEALGFLQERRSALISAAVTGKIDVRGWSAGAESEEPELAMVAEQSAGYSTHGGVA